MVFAALATKASILVPATLAFFQDAAEQSVGWDPVSLWHQMGWMGRTVVIILFIMSAWSIGVMIDRYIAFNAARKQSRAFAPAVAGALRDRKIDEAIRIAERNKKSHFAKVVTAARSGFRGPHDTEGRACRRDFASPAAPAAGATTL